MTKQEFRGTNEQPTACISRKKTIACHSIDAAVGAARSARRALPSRRCGRASDRIRNGSVVMKALLILWLKSLGVLIVAVLVLATTQQWDESTSCVSTYCS